jgi:hypothetical protein
MTDHDSQRERCRGEEAHARHRANLTDTGACDEHHSCLKHCECNKDVLERKTKRQPHADGKKACCNDELRRVVQGSAESLPFTTDRVCSP